MNVHHRWATAALLIAASFGIASGANAASTFYTITDLGTLGWSNSYATGINNSGQVVGCSSIDTASHAFLYSNGTMNNLDSLGGNSSAAAINNSGQVVGFSVAVGGAPGTPLFPATARYLTSTT